MARRAYILTNRKRVIIALVHTVVFLGVALRGPFTRVAALRAGSPASSWIMAAVYLLVSSILVLLAARSLNALERIYFACCTTSAGFGLARQLVGDPRMYAAAWIRVAMLALAIAVGLRILRAYGGSPVRSPGPGPDSSEWLPE